MMQGKPDSLDVEPDQELSAPGNTIFEELAGSDGPTIPDPGARSSTTSKLSKSREGQSNVRNSELYIGGLEDMKVRFKRTRVFVASCTRLFAIFWLRRSNLNLK